MKILNKLFHINNARAYKLAIATLLVLANSLATAAPQLLDQVIAIVDDDVVLASELKHRYQQILNKMAKSNTTAPPKEEIQRQVLDQLILENIQRQMAYRAGVRISDAQLNDSVQRIAQQNGMTLEQFKEALEKDGQSYTTTREQIRGEMLLQQVQQGNVNQRVQITNQEINNFLASEEGQAVTAPEYRMLHTLIPVPGNSSAEQNKQANNQAMALYNAIIAGTNYQEAMSSKGLKTADLGWRKAADLPSLIASTATTLDKGQTAAPIKSASGYHLVKLVDKRGDGQVIPQTRARHILLKPSAIRDNAATELAINKLRQKLLNGADFTSLAREHSEDIGSAVEGGDLGWTNPGQLVGAFQKAMDNTPIGAISPAFRSEYGWHVLQVQERRDKDVTEDIRRNIARNHIHKRKYDDELQTWLQKIRDEAYVDIK